MLTNRQAEILNRIVKDYIDLAQPISSEFLEKKHNFGICPATIRIEMQKLTDKGFLSQPHTSAGRVPTDKGYRFFVNDLLKDEISEFEDILKVEKFFKEMREDILQWSTRLTKFLAEESSNFAILNLLERDLTWKEGWEEVLEEPEFEDRDFISDFAKFIENFQGEIKDLKINPVRNQRFLNGVNSEIKIYIGRETPFPKAKNFSIISSKCCLPDNEKAILALLGPKRMDYNRNISLISSLTKLLGEL